MPVTLVGLAALAADDIRTGLSRCETIQEILGVDEEADPEAAALALLFIGDAGEAVAARYGLIMVELRGSEAVAADLVKYSFSGSVEFWIPKPDDADLAEEDFLASHNLSEAITELWAMHRTGGLNFELTAASLGQPVRDDEVGAGSGDIGNVLEFALECYDE